MEKILEVKDLRVSFHTYAGEVKAVRGIDFDLGKGEAISIVGESGCGKTVTSKSILGILPTQAEVKKTSQILFNGKNILRFNDKEWSAYRGSDVGMIFQDPMTSLNPTMKVGRQIGESLVLHRGMSKSQAFEEAVKMLELVNIPNARSRANQYPHEFSGGMRQRAMIAIALACNPKILVADEPTTALDVTIQAQIIDLMKDLQKKLGTSIVLITHDLGVVADLASRIIVMYAGQIVETGTADEVFYNPKHPYTWALLKAVPRLDSNKKEELVTIPGTPPDLLAPPVGCPFTARCAYCMQICKEVPPSFMVASDTHKAACWLHHPYAPKVDLPIGIGGAK